MFKCSIGKPPKGSLQIGVVAKSKILKGQELFFDYKIKEISWLVIDAKKIAITIDLSKGMGPIFHTSYAINT